MINGIIGKKVGMTQLFAPDGTVTPVTVIKAGPCVVVQKKSAGGKDGYDAVQVGLVEERPIKLKRKVGSCEAPRFPGGGAEGWTIPGGGRG